MNSFNDLSNYGFGTGNFSERQRNPTAIVLDLLIIQWGYSYKY